MPATPTSSAKPSTAPAGADRAQRAHPTAQRHDPPTATSYVKVWLTRRTSNQPPSIHRTLDGVIQGGSSRRPEGTDPPPWVIGSLSWDATVTTEFGASSARSGWLPEGRGFEEGYSATPPG
jgi:hypothetical protein